MKSKIIDLSTILVAGMMVTACESKEKTEQLPYIIFIMSDDHAVGSEHLWRPV